MKQMARQGKFQVAAVIRQRGDFTVAIRAPGTGNSRDREWHYEMKKKKKKDGKGRIEKL